MTPRPGSFPGGIERLDPIRDLGRRMGIRDIPETWQSFARLLDAYEREHFAFDAGGRVVRFLPPRSRPYYVRQLPQIRSYPGGYEVARRGTAPQGCPVPQFREETATPISRSPERAG